MTIKKGIHTSEKSLVKQVVNRGIIIKLILKKYYLKIPAGFFRLRTARSVRAL